MTHGAGRPTDDDVLSVLSAARMSTYQACCSSTSRALDLYSWNAQASSALMLPAHFAEVAIRNAASQALEEVYGSMWPWSSAFRQSLPRPSPPVYQPRGDLIRTANRHQTTGKVIADLKFAFWEHIFTSRHQERLWKGRAGRLFPYAPQGNDTSIREDIHDDLRELRLLRNRIAHHEPIFQRDLAADLARMLRLIRWRSASIHDWVTTIETASSIITARPTP